MHEKDVQISPEWNKISPDDFSGLIMVIGAPDTGKSTLSRYLYQRLCQRQGKAAYLDGDPGQSRLGPPTTITIALSLAGECAYPPRGQVWRKFIGSNSPSGHMLPMLAGAKRLVEQAQHAGYSNIVYDTSGLVEAKLGGLALKYAKIDLLQPDVVVALQRETELEALLRGLRHSQRTKIITLKPSPAVVKRDSVQRQNYRQAAFKAHFQKSKSVIIDWQRYAILPAPRFALHKLVSLEDRQGFCLGLGLVLGIDREKRRLELLTPLEDLGGVYTIFLGDLLLSPETFIDQK